MMAPVLLGRSTEQGEMRAAIEEARAGRGGAIVLRGPPGIGKTALLEDAVGAAAGFRVLRCRGLQSESRLAFAGLADLLAPVLDRAGRLPAPQGAALRAALALGPPTDADRLAVYAAVLGLIGEAASDAPVLIAVDDAHFIDRSTREALAFCARRIQDEPVVILAATRETGPEPAEVEGIADLAIGPLDEEASRALLASATGTAPLAPGVARAVLAAAAGNPLGLVELPQTMSADERAGCAPLPEPLRAGAAIAAAYRRRIEDLEAGARRALLVAAVSGDGALQPIVAALTGLGGGAPDLAAAEAAGFLVLEDDTALLRPPILRSVLLELCPPAERREAHAALAGALDPGRDAERRAWHLAAAAVGPDEAAAAALEHASGRAATRTGYAAAAEALTRAAELSPGGEDRARRLLGAARASLHAGALEATLALLERAAAATSDPALGAEIGYLKGLATVSLGPIPDGSAILAEEAERAAETAPATAAVMLCRAAIAHSLDPLPALAAARRALALARPVGGPVAGVAAGLVGWALALHGERRAALERMAELDAVAGEVDPLSPLGQLIGLTALCQVWLGDLAAASARLGRWLEAARGAGSLTSTAQALVATSELDLRLGRLDAARAHALEAVRLLEEIGRPSGLAFCHGALARAHGLAGRERECAECSLRAEEAADRNGTVYGRVHAAAARASCALAHGRPAEAAERLEWVGAVFAERAVGEPNVLPWQPDLVESLVRLGRLDEARAALATLSRQAFRGGGDWARAVACRGRGMLDARFEPHFHEALALHARSPTPLDAARTELAFGERLRRAGRRTEGRERLDRALRGFEAAGATAWARRAREEIAATGAGLPRRSRRSSDELSPREVQVAVAAAEGLTNREVAARLFLSEKTVERHLGSIYRKLGLRSRTELARRFAERGPERGVPQ
jgi:DNA-binding CsgD family transcriptional regulator